MSCCTEPGCRRKQPIKLLRNELTGRWYFITRWKPGRTPGTIIAIEKHEVPEGFRIALDAMPEAPKGGSR